MLNRLAITRKEHFNAAHRLHNPKWDSSKNKEVFGKCNNPNYHGHNYELYVTIIGQIDTDTGYVIDTKLLSKIIKEDVLDVMDHKNLNLDVEYFESINPTLENITVVIYNILRGKIDEELEIKIKLYEAPRNYVEYPYTA
ncbi:6-pyruvoyl trahydropterin synthase family protein [Pseudofulvibacter geojedonensis]|uniref:6-carboxy-5,6,7,8-tetrahydropterin synthase n=1 Tax=Pseudofulvibacter geojedonensis TaxID=1123758 RepID=A0ABW3I2C2_9FLAO